MRMKIYTVHILPNRNALQHPPVLVKEGFNVIAFVFTLLWALYHRIWGLAVLIFAFNMVMLLLDREGVFTGASLSVMQLGFNLIVGLHANDWLRRTLKKRGYVAVDLVSGTSTMRAGKRYFERFVATPG